MSNWFGWIKKQEGKSEKEQQELWLKRRNWVEAHSVRNGDYSYEIYLGELYDKEGDKAIPEQYDTWNAEQLRIANEKEEALKNKKLHRIAHSRTKLTNTEKYLVDVCGFNIGYLNSISGQGCLNKCPAELRAKIKRMREKGNYLSLKQFAIEMKNELHGEFNLGKFAEFMSKSNNYWTLRELLDENLGKFVIAEQKIDGLTEQEIEQLAILEAI
jgi:hypothetical protein